MDSTPRSSIDMERRSIDEKPKSEHDLSVPTSPALPPQPDTSRDLEKNEAPAAANNAQTNETDDPFLVKFEEGDPNDPRQWKTWFKTAITFLLGMLALVGSFGSSVISPAQADLSVYLSVSTEVTVLAVSLYVLGFAVGPSIWAPISEVYGRKVSMLPAIFILGLFSIGTATSTTAAGVFVTRFFGGVFACAAISNVSAALGDMYEPKARGTAVAFYAICVTGGPTIGPVVGSALVVNKHLGWRWTEYIEAIFAGVMVLIAVIFMPEMYAPVLLSRKAKRMRKETGDDRYWHPHDGEKITPKNIITRYFSRPLRMLFTEPMVTSIALYASFVYGILYLTLEVFPIVFEQQRQYSLVVSTLPFLGLLAGVLAAFFLNVANQPLYARAVSRNGGRAVPEARLPPMFVGGILFVAGLFLFGWTAAPRYHWILPVIGAAFIGAGFNVIFQQCINFLVDVYGPYAASAVAANTFLRSLLACGLPLAAKPMFTNMGVPAASSLLGAIACLALPVPFIFMKFGLRLRKMSKFAPVDETAT